MRNTDSSNSDSMMLEDLPGLQEEAMEEELLRVPQQLHLESSGERASGSVKVGGLLDRAGSNFLTLKTFSGKSKKIQKCEFLEMFERGEYYPPEGCTLFSDRSSSTFYIYGGARSNKPGHWDMASYLFQISTEKMSGQNNAFDIVSFKMFNQSESKSSQFLKLFGASGLTEKCSEKDFQGFVINGKNLDCPGEKFISNEIQTLKLLLKQLSEVLSSGQVRIALLLIS